MEDKQVVPGDWTPEEISKANEWLEARMIEAGGHGRCRVLPDRSITHGGPHAEGDCHAIRATWQVIENLRMGFVPCPVTRYTRVVMLEWSTATNEFRPEEVIEVVGRILDDDGFTVHPYPVPLATKGGPFTRDLEALINHHSMEGGSHTPDFILASYLKQCLDTWNLHTRERDRWWGNRSTLGVANDHPAVPTSEQSLLR